VLIHAGRLVATGVEPARAFEVAVTATLTDDPELARTVAEIAHAVLA
jgi:hypothetical protein